MFSYKIPTPAESLALFQELEGLAKSLGGGYLMIHLRRWEERLDRDPEVALEGLNQFRGEGRQVVDPFPSPLQPFRFPMSQVQGNPSDNRRRQQMEP